MALDNAPTPKVKTPAPRKRVYALARLPQGAPTLPKPQAFTSGAGAVVALLVLNMVWALWRDLVGAGKGLRAQVVKTVAAIWVIGLGMLILVEFQPRLAVMFMVLVTIGNVLAGGAANQAAVNALNTIFTRS